VQKVSFFLAYIRKLLYLCGRFEKAMSQDQRKNIIKTAGELFFRLGIRSVSIDDICRELGMSKKTFYVYFGSKDELIEQMLQANIDYMSGKMQELLELRDFRQVVKRFIKHQEAEKNDVRRVPQLVYDLKKYYPRQFADFQVKCFETQKEYIKRYLELGVAAGLVRANLNIELTALLFAKIHSDAIRDFEIIEAHNHKMHQLAHTALDVFVRGVLSDEGLKLFNEK
jgi:AcrR family transcriptional regulator